MRKSITVLMILMVLCVSLTGCSRQTDAKNLQISINIYDKENELIYSESIETTESKLFDTIKDIEELSIKHEDSEYGKFITSIKGIEQGDNYYWNYYINSEYATVGVSSYSLENNDVFDFRIEKFE